MNTKVEEALDVWEAGDLGYKEACYRKCDVDRRIAQQDATIARAVSEVAQFREVADLCAAYRGALELIASLTMSQFYKPQDIGAAAIKVASAALNQEQGK